MGEKNWEWHALRAEDKVKTLEHQLAAARAELAVERRALEIATEGRVWGGVSLLTYARRKAYAELAKSKEGEAG